MSWESAMTIRRINARNASKPKYADIKVGYNCNNNCLFCTAEWKKELGARDTQTLLDEVERVVSQDGVERIVYSGGEPTFREDLVEIMRHAQKLGVPQQEIQSNGRRLGNRDYLDTLHDAGLNSCFISIHGVDALTHDALTQRPGSFRQVCAGLTNIDRLGLLFATNTVACRQNYRSLGSVVRFIASSFSSVAQIKLSYTKLQGGAADNLSHIVVPLPEAAPYFREAIEIGNEMDVNVVTEFVPACLLGKRYGNADELNSPPVISLSDLNLVDSNWIRYSEGMYYWTCKECDLRQICCGIHPLHHENFGEPSCLAPISLAPSGL
jgi:MoaA/NifB/PqqE/SkfB family radical SAM enzyme